MTPSQLFAPPPPRTNGRWLALVGMIIAAVIGTLLMSFFIDAVHLSMARGEALRVTQGMVDMSDSAPGQDISVAQLRLQRSSP